MILADDVIIDAGPFHVPVLATLHQRCFGDVADPAEVWSERAIAELFAMPGSFALIASGPEQSIGYVLARDLPHRQPKDCDLLSLGVLPEARRRGVGRRLLGAVRRRAQGRGIQRLTLDVAEDNRAAQALYHALDFRFDGRRKGYYRRSDGRTVDALLLSCHLT